MVSVQSAWTGGLHSYVYMFCCFEAEQWLVKFGVSDAPMKRLDSLRTDCPFPAKVFAFIAVPARFKAFEIEGALLDAFVEWRTRGEWIQFSPDKKAEFNAIMRQVLSIHRTASYPMRWEQMAVTPIARLKNAKQRAYRWRLSKIGSARRQFVRLSR